VSSPPAAVTSGLSAPSRAVVELTGDVARPLRLTVADLRGWPEHRADVSFDCASSGIQHHRFRGPLLYDVLRDARPATLQAARTGCAS
jgi:DMSO/TMAO reductase YedYZ molybdopterin-dependent catalytic subunit